MGASQVALRAKPSCPNAFELFVLVIAARTLSYKKVSLSLRGRLLNFLSKLQMNLSLEDGCLLNCLEVFFMHLIGAIRCRFCCRCESLEDY